MTERIETLWDLADAIEAIDNSDDSEMGFDMEKHYFERNHTSHPCGTACCIGGWAQHLRPDLQKYSLEQAVSRLGAHPKEAYLLCYPRPEEYSVWDATPAQAARAIRILAETGKTDWPRAMKEVSE